MTKYSSPIYYIWYDQL